MKSLTQISGPTWGSSQPLSQASPWADSHRRELGSTKQEDSVCPPHRQWVPYSGDKDFLQQREAEHTLRLGTVVCASTCLSLQRNPAHTDQCISLLQMWEVKGKHSPCPLCSQLTGRCVRLMVYQGSVGGPFWRKASSSSALPSSWGPSLISTTAPSVIHQGPRMLVSCCFPRMVLECAEQNINPICLMTHCTWG